MGLTIPEAYGGLGLMMEEEVRLGFLLGQTSPAFRSYIGINNDGIERFYRDVRLFLYD